MQFLRPFLCAMNNKTRNLTHGALIAALYVILTHLQNIIFPESTSFAIQFRASEAMCILAFFTPAAIWGLTVGCFLFNLTFAGALPLDFLVGWELSVYIGGGFWLNALYVAIGEAAVLLTLGTVLYFLLCRSNLYKRIF